MAHPTRGRRSGTYEIEELLAVDLDRLEIHFRHAAAYQPDSVRLNIDNTPAARQMLRAMADSIKVADNGDRDSGWESAQTVHQSVFMATHMVEALASKGFDTFADRRIDVPILRDLYSQFGSSSTKRSACWLLARVVRDNHPHGRAVNVALKNTRFAVDETNPFTYDDRIAAAIEQAARAVYKERLDAQRELFRRLGHDTSSRAWLRIPAAQLIEWAQRAHPDAADLTAHQPPLAAPYERQVAWALTHPWRFGHGLLRTRLPRGPQMRTIGTALYPDHVTLTAALILHCLGENSGFNLSVLLQKDADTLTYIGSDHALEHNVKARNRSEDTRPTYLAPFHTPGGIVETLTGLTRFARHARGHLTQPDDTPAPVRNRLYVEHTADPTAAKVIASGRIHNAWRNNRFDKHWDPTAGTRDDVPIRMSALRLEAQRRAMDHGLHADIHGHSERTKMHYSSHVLPDHIFNKAAIAAQNAFHDDAVAAFTIVADATDGAAAELARIDPTDVMDVEIGLCTSGGNAPDGTGKPCNLGMVACFTCPNGYRTIDHVPGLLAAVELSDIIARNDPDEWANGQASSLRFYAQACLDQFRPSIVANIRRATDLTPHILTVTGMYMELRNG